MNRSIHRLPMLAWAAGLLLSPALPGCVGPVLISGGPHASIDSVPGGETPYYLPKDIVVVEGTATYASSGAVTFKNGDFQVDTTFRLRSSEGTASVQTVPDESRLYSLKLDPGGASEDSLTVEKTSLGLLKSVNVKSISQAGEITKNVLTFAASIAAIALMVLDHPDAESLVCQQFALPGSAPPDPSKKGSSQTPAAGTDATPACSPTIRASIKGLSLKSLSFLAKSADARRLWEKKVVADELVKSRASQKAEIEGQIRSAASKDLESLKTRLALINAAFDASRLEQKGIVDALDAQLQAFLKKELIVSEPKKLRFQMRFELDELPTAKEILAQPSNTHEDVGKWLQGKFPRVFELYEKTGLIVTLDPATVAPPANGAAEATGEQGVSRIYYRQPYAAVLATFTRFSAFAGEREAEAKDVVRMDSIRSVEVIHPKQQPLWLGFKPADFAERQMEIAFDERGRLVKVSHSGKSAVAGVTGAAAQGLTAAMDAYSGTLTKIATIQETSRKIELSGTTSEIERLKKEKELLDARLDLAGASGNYELSLEKKQLDAQLAALQSRASLETAQSTAAQKQEIDALKAKLDLLNQQVALLKAQQELDKLRGPR